jgi:hypothetical protein
MPSQCTSRATLMLSLAPFALGSIVGVSACDAVDGPDSLSQARSALSSGRERIAVPGYFTPNDSNDWFEFAAHENESSIDNNMIFVNGPDNGPPPAFDSALAGDLSTLTPLISFGYVQFPYGRPWAAIQADIDNWINNYQSYGLGGIFFDEAIRCQGPPTTCPNPGDDLAKVEFVEQYVHNSNPQMVSIFNWGTVSTQMYDYVYCTDIWGAVPDALAALYVTAEMTHDVYLAPSTDTLFANNNWLNGFLPQHFINIAYKNPDPNTWGTWNFAAMLAKAPTRNAAYM